MRRCSLTIQWFVAQVHFCSTVLFWTTLRRWLNQLNSATTVAVSASGAIWIDFTS